MVENHFLERLNLLFQKAMENTRPFGGKQVSIPSAITGQPCSH